MQRFLLSRRRQMHYSFMTSLAQIGVFSFSHNQNNHSSTINCVYITCIYCCLCVKIKGAKMLHGAKDHGCIGFVFYSKDPSMSPMTDNDITQDAIQGLGSPLYICGFKTKLLTTVYHTHKIARWE